MTRINPHEQGAHKTPKEQSSISNHELELLLARGKEKRIKQTQTNGEISETTDLTNIYPPNESREEETRYCLSNSFQLPENTFLNFNQIKEIINLLKSSFKGWIVNKIDSSFETDIFIKTPSGNSFLVRIPYSDGSSFKEPHTSELCIGGMIREKTDRKIFLEEITQITEELKTILQRLSLPISREIKLDASETPPFDSPSKNITHFFTRLFEGEQTRKKILENAKGDKERIALLDDQDLLIEENPTYSQQVNHVNPNDIISLVAQPIDIKNRSKDRVIENYREQWLKEYLPAIKNADLIYIPPGGGIGDRVYQAYFAQALAVAYPNKKIILRLPTEQEAQIYSPQTDNLEILSSYDPEKQEELVDSNLSQGQKIVIFPLIQPSSLPDNSKEYYFPEDNPDVQFINVTGNNSLWDDWGCSVIREETDLTKAQEEMAITGDTESIIGRYRQAQQLKSLRSKLVNLLGIDENLLPDHIPIKKPEKNNYQSDLVIIYDAATEDDTKIITESQLAELLALLTDQYPDLKISIVNGKTHAYYEQINDFTFPDIERISGNLEDVVTQLWNAKLVLTVDTGFAHILGELVAANNEDDDKPQIVELFGLAAPFPVEKFRPRGISSFVAVKGLVQELSPRLGILPILEPILDNL